MTTPQTKLQVFTFGHPLSQETKDWLTSQYGPEGTGWQVYLAYFHASQLHEAPKAVIRCMKKLHAQGADMSGRTKTFFVPTGLSIGVALLGAAWDGLTGEMPKWLNLIKQTDPKDPLRSYYAPCPELPFVDAAGFRQSMSRNLRHNFFGRAEMQRAS